MLFSLDVIRARKGDCLMLHFGPEDDPHHVMIDGGPSGVYSPHLKPRIKQIREARGIADNKPLQVDVLMISHVDDDHIQGILDMTKELIASKMAHKPQLVQVLSFWHNSFDNIIGNSSEELTANFKQQSAAASVGGEVPDDLDIDDDQHDQETVVSSLKVLASIAQGSQLRADVQLLGFELNLEFEGKLIAATENILAMDIGEGLKLTVVGPMVHELEDLRTKHEEWLIELKKKGQSPPEALAAYVDESVPNLSSIVVLAEAGDKRILLTGDARGDKILKGLELIGKVEEGGKFHVNVLKVPHHGSSNNLAIDFFERITADHYVFSGDGEHGNPERESLEMLLKARGDAKYTIHLTYPIDEIDKGRKEDWEKEQNKEKKKKVTNPAKKVRADWSKETNSLAGLFEAHADFANKVSVVEEGKPHLINLLGDVGF